ncbi:hypothetical protein B7463_g7992, partial [Scytalidium lignicola]
MLHSRGKISIFEIVVYAPCIPVVLWYTIRDGLRQSAGWLYVMIFAQVRIAGAITQILSESNSTNTSLYTAQSILQSIGLNPLIFIVICHLSRINRSISISRSSRRPISRLITHGIGALVIGASALSIAGGVNSAKSLSAPSTSGETRTFHASGTTKAGIVLFVLAYIQINLCIWVTARHFRATEAGERRVGQAIILSIPFIAIRLVYSLLAVFSTNPKFNLLTGSAIIWLVMAVLEEIIVVIIFLVAGYVAGIEMRKVQEGISSTVQNTPEEQILMTGSHPHGGYDKMNVQQKEAYRN